MTSFTANPASITSGESFTLSWTAPCGYVSIAQKGQAPFTQNQPSNGSYQLGPNMAGYPTVAGDTVYEATNGDVAQRFSATVTMKAKVAPTISLSGGSSCYPVHAGNAGCNVQVAATASNYDALSWSGCCSGSGTTATCHVSHPGSFTCMASATGTGGSTQATMQVTGTNSSPAFTGASWDTDKGCNSSVLFAFYTDDEEGLAYCPSATAGGACTGISDLQCPATGHPTWATARATTGTAGGLCYVQISVYDVWGARADSQAYAAGVTCP